MKNETWIYTIKSGYTGTVLSFLMGAGFTALAIWLHQSQNGAFLIGVVLACLMWLAFLLAFYRAVCYRVRIGDEGFFYRTSPWNGRSYTYRDIEKAWVSAGRESNGVFNAYCNISFPSDMNTPVIRFLFYANDEEAIEFFLKKAEAWAGTTSPEEEKTYSLTGTAEGIPGIILAVFIMLIFTMLFASRLYISHLSGAGTPWPFLVGIIAGAVLFLYAVIRRFCFKAEIGRESFYLRTSPWNGRSYLYTDIKNYRVYEKVYRGARTSGRSYYHFFEFTDTSGKTRKFLFSEPMHGGEITVLQERIQKAKHV